MTQISVKVETGQVKSVVAKARTAVQSLPAKYVRPEMEQARDELVDPYPAELPNQKYVRTYKRRDATKVIATPGNNQHSSKYVLESNPRYPGGRTGNPYVLGDAMGQGQNQRYHAGRWKLMRTAVEQAVARIAERGNEYFRSIMERNGAP